MTTPNAGTYELTQDDGDLLLYTSCAGAMARMGHDLTIKAERWTATVTAGDTPQSSSLEASVAADSLVIVGSTGGIKPISDSDRQAIEDNLTKTVQPGRYPEVRFVSDQLAGSFDAATVTGTVTLHGQSQERTFTAKADGDQVVLSGSLNLTDFGIKPFSTMMGTLKLADEVTFEATVRLS